MLEPYIYVLTKYMSELVVKLHVRILYIYAY